MPTAPKATDNMSKHLTNAEKAARGAAEADVIPDRGGHVTLTPPALMKGVSGAMSYWTRVLKRMEGLSVLDDLDSDALGIYCVMMARYGQQCKLLKAAGKALKDAESDPEAVTEAASKLDAVSGKMQGLERNILQYAEKLGLTPSGRVRLAQKRAAQAEVDPDADLFGD